jgi:ribosomal protein S14
MSTFVISCQDCGQESGWVVAEMASPESFREIAKAKAKGRIVTLDKADTYKIGEKPMYGTKDCKTCGSKSKSPELFS